MEKLKRNPTHSDALLSGGVGHLGTAAGGGCPPQKSSSPHGTKSTGVPKQAPVTNNGVGNTTADGGAKQALAGGQNATDATADSGTEKRGKSQVQGVPLAVAIKSLDMESINLYGMLSTELAKMADIVKKTKTEGCKDLFAKICETFNKLHENNNILRKVRSQQDRQNQPDDEPKAATIRDELAKIHARLDGQDDLLRSIYTGQQQQQQQNQNKPTYAGQAKVRTKPANVHDDTHGITDTPLDQPPDTQADQNARTMEPNQARATSAQTEERSKASTRRKNAEDLVRSRQPRTEAITISNPSAGNSYADVMRKVLAEVDLKETGVEVTRTRRTKTGAILLEVKGKEGADLLASKLRGTIGEWAEVARPTKSTKVLVTNIPDWLDDHRVVSDIQAADEGLAEAKISIRENAGGGRVATMTVSVATALRLSVAGAIRVGLGKSRIKLLEAKKIRCFRCDDLGHIATSCTAENASKKCFRCRQTGHLVAACPRSTSKTKNREVNLAKTVGDATHQSADKEAESLSEAASAKA